MPLVCLHSYSYYRLLPKLSFHKQEYMQTSPIHLQLRRDNTPPIQRNRRPINPRARPTTQPNTRPSHILRTPNSAQRDPTLNHILELLQRRLHHLALERAARNGIARDAALAEVAGEHAAHVVQAGFAGGVGEGFERGDAQPVDAADVYDAGGRGGRGGGFEERRHGLGELEDALEVEG